MIAEVAAAAIVVVVVVVVDISQQAVEVPDV